MKLSVLNQVQVCAGGDAAEALRETIALAQIAEQLGYYRYWVAEHHGSSDTACPCPEVLLAAIGAATKHIRIGAGGILLPHYSPLKVAECVRMLDNLYPGRVDLGIGRAPGAGTQEIMALQRYRSERPFGDDFDEQLIELLHFIRGTFPDHHRFKSIQVSPNSSGNHIPVWLLGASERSAALAASLGLPYAFAQFICPNLAEQSCRRYHTACDCCARRSKLILAVSVVCVDSDAGLRDLLASLTQNRKVARDGSQNRKRDAVTRSQSGRLLKQRFVGTPGTVREDLISAAATADADEIIVLTPSGDFKSRRRSYELLAEAFELSTFR